MTTVAAVQVVSPDGDSISNFKVKLPGFEPKQPQSAASITVRRSLTVQPITFNSIVVDVSVTLPCDVSCIDDAVVAANDYLEQRVLLSSKEAVNKFKAARGMA